MTLGTTHHPCNRMSAWLGDLLAAHPGLTCLYQHGASDPVAAADCVELLPRDELLTIAERVDVIVTQGAGSIMDARRLGRLPIVVPRRPDLDEVVDDHQITFARQLDGIGWIRTADTEAAFVREVEAGLADPESLRIPIEPSPLPETAKRMAEVLDSLEHSAPGFVSVRRLAFLLRRGGAAAD